MIRNEDQSRATPIRPTPPRRGNPRLITVLALIGVAIATYQLDRRMTPRLSAGPMVQLVSTDALTIVWETIPRRPGQLIATVQGRPDQTIEAEFQGRHFVARINDLTPRTEVSYQIEHRGLPGRRFTLTKATTRTAPAKGAPVRFIAFGDSGGGAPVQERMSRRMIEWDPDLVIHTGDLVYLVGAQRDYFSTFYQPYAALIRSVPFYPVLGNHDTKTRQGQPLLDNFELPTNGPSELKAERHFAFESGNALFVGIDSTTHKDTLSTTVATWVKNQLLASSARWKFAYLHHPPYSGGDIHGSDLSVRESLTTAFEEGGADVVFCGHEHHYERTAPLLQNKVVDRGGVVYVVTGAGGVSLYPMRESPPDFVVAHNDKKYSFTLVDVEGDIFHGKQIAEDGEILDEWHMTKAP
jgi:predicted phosphodiesterase